LSNLAGADVAHPTANESKIALNIPNSPRAETGLRAGSPQFVVPESNASNRNPAATSLRIWSGVGDHGDAGKETGLPAVAHLPGKFQDVRKNSSAPAPQIAFDVASASNQSAQTVAQSLRVDPLLGGGGTADWRQQQLAKLAAEQKAREDEWNRLRQILYQWLVPSGPGGAE
jgi:hypothetical protein